MRPTRLAIIGFARPGPECAAARRDWHDLALAGVVTRAQAAAREGALTRIRVGSH